MGRPITSEYGQSLGVLKYFPYLGAPCVVAEAGVSADDNGNKIVKAGTPYPANDATCLGYLLHDVDVTNGDAPGTYVYQGTLDTEKLTANQISVSDAAKKATPKVNFAGEAYKAQ